MHGSRRRVIVTADHGEDAVGPTGVSEELTGPLPDAVRARVVALSAQALSQLAAEHLPASLKRVASFAPVRRAKLAGNQIAAVLETDEAFRGRVALQVRATAPELARALEEGTAPAAADPVELAALAYLLRPPGWSDVVAAASTAVEAGRDAAAAQEVSAQVDRLRRRLEDADAELRQMRERHRTQLAATKAENAELRRKLADARSASKAAEQAAQTVTARAEHEVARAANSSASADAELRRLRSRLEELEREVTVARRAERAEKGEGALRARLLLDTLLDAGQGLRRELALPPVEGAPADAVEADIAGHGAPTPSSQGSLSVDDPALLDQLLSMPRVHLIVDGYNVTKNAWPDTSLEIQRDRLLGGLAPLATRTGAEMTVVFDAADTVERPLVKRPRGVRVLYSPYGVIADDVIRELVAAEPGGRPVVVVTSDQAVVDDVRRAGARVVASLALSRLLARS